MNCNFSVMGICGFAQPLVRSEIPCDGGEAKESCPLWAISAAVRLVQKTRTIEQIREAEA